MRAKNIKVAVAMSGGVDSSVAAALMCKKYGPENVFGVTAKLFCYNNQGSSDKACCSLGAIDDAKAVCAKLGIPHYVIDLSKEFEKEVVSNFVSEYRQGHTPIPCIPCNKAIKFDSLLKKVEALGADKLVTGHYVRIKERKGKLFLAKGLDPLKDQSYFLYNLDQSQLKAAIFPLGGLKKTEVRKIARKLGLKTAEKRESQGICFVAEGRVTDWLSGKIKAKPGNIVDVSGQVIGKHDGVIYYTVGQRKRIGGGYTEPMYVVEVRAKSNEVVIGTEKELYRSEIEFPGEKPAELKNVIKCTVKVRYNMEEAKCQLKGSKIIFDKPQRAITPGQSIVFYDNDLVLGGAILH